MRPSCNVHDSSLVAWHQIRRAMESRLRRSGTICAERNRVTGFHHSTRVSAEAAREIGRPAAEQEWYVDSSTHSEIQEPAAFDSLDRENVAGVRIKCGARGDVASAECRAGCCTGNREDTISIESNRATA